MGALSLQASSEENTTEYLMNIFKDFQQSSNVTEQNLANKMDKIIVRFNNNQIQLPVDITLSVIALALLCQKIMEKQGNPFSPFFSLLCGLAPFIHGTLMYATKFTENAHHMYLITNEIQTLKEELSKACTFKEKCQA